MSLLSPVEVTAAPSRLDAAVARVCDDDATITDVRALLHLLVRADIPVDPVRTQGLLELASRALGRFPADVLYAPPAALAEVVRDARQACGAAHLGCVEHVFSWVFDGVFCSPTCRVDHMRSQGETWADR